MANRNGKQSAKKKPPKQGAGADSRGASAAPHSGLRHSLRFFASRWVLVPLGLVLILAVAAWTYYRPIQVWYVQAREERVLVARLDAVQQYNDSLRKEIASLETTAGVEEYARKSLNLSYAEDNTVIILQDGEPVTDERGSRDVELARLNDAPEPFGPWTTFLDRLFLEQ